MSSNTAVIINTAHYIQLTCQCTQQMNHYFAIATKIRGSLTSTFKKMYFVVLKLIGSYKNTLNLDLGDGKNLMLIFHEANVHVNFQIWKTTLFLVLIEENKSLYARHDHYLNTRLIWTYKGSLKSSSLIRQFFRCKFSAIMLLCILRLKSETGPPPVHFTRRLPSVLCVVGWLFCRLGCLGNNMAAAGVQ